ncbi:multifunctional protein ADE2 isoform X3 [Tribolium madens]|uniref:multifunctional protein ADE2 isoform X3 n=1 Tax=Tribolium madens TaxID=41895 RepID=UPI001CF74729|nr:multifunctional protein ADE2 isoform X3 [Tribolium madens]
MSETESEDDVFVATSATATSLPEKSKAQYERAYKLFQDWREKNQRNSLSENVLLAYFQELSKRNKPSSLWAAYSMLRTTLNLKNNVDISKYFKLGAFLKRKSDGYKPKKSKTLTPQQIKEFLSSAPDKDYLFTKVGLIFSIMGACRREELMKIEINHIEDLNTSLLVHIPDTKTKTERQFEIGGSFYHICKKYMKIRPSNLTTNRFFLNYQRGKCINQPIGINKFGSLASVVAKYLKLPDPACYTGHYLRSSAKLADSDANITALKRHGGWRSTTVAEVTVKGEEISEDGQDVISSLIKVEAEGINNDNDMEISKAVTLKRRNSDIVVKREEISSDSENGQDMVSSLIKVETEEISNDDSDMELSDAVTTPKRRKFDTVVGDYKLGSLIIEGKTKQVYELPGSPDLCLLLNKDRITAGDGVKAHDLVGKAAISNKTNGKVFEILNSVGVKTSFVKAASDVAFISKKCEMIPIEWVTRRLATGSFLKRNPGVPEGYRFYPPKNETFFKDDANHDPQWSTEQIISAKFKVNGLEIGPTEVDIMTRTSILVFEILEKVWATRNCALIDMKIEFGVDKTGEILVADVIDSDSWRLWPSGDKRLMVDKQVYRNLTTVTSSDLDTVKRNFEWIVDQLDHLAPPNDHLIVILMGSPSDADHCKTIQKHCEKLGLNTELRVTSAHKGTDETIKIVRYYESLPLKVVFVAVAGRSNGLGPVVSGNSPFPVINCPPLKSDNVDRDVWSSLNVPSGLGCSTVLYPEAAALNAANIIGLSNYVVWSRLRVKQLENYVTLAKADKGVRSN